MSEQRGRGGASERRQKATGILLDRGSGNSGRLNWRRTPVATDTPEPDGQRGQIHRRRVGHHGSECRVNRWKPRGSAVCRSRQRARHTCREAGADLRAVPPGGRLYDAQVWRYGSGFSNCDEAVGSAWRTDLGGEQRKRREHFLLHGPIPAVTQAARVARRLGSAR